MKRAILAQRLPHLLLGGLLTALLVVSSVVLPATPAQATDQYLFDFSIAEDLSFQKSFYLGKEKYFTHKYETEDSNKICEKLKSDFQQSLKESENEYKRNWGIINQKVDNCRLQGSLFFIDINGKFDESLLRTTSSTPGIKINNKDELELKAYSEHLLGYFIHIAESNDLTEIGMQENLGIVQYTFPGKIKRVTPDIGKISGNTWTLDDPPTGEEADNIANNKGTIIITAELHGSKLGLILGITIPAALVIVAVIVLLIVRNNRKKKQQNLPAYPAGSGTYPPPPFMPGNSAYPVQSPVPGYPAAPGAPGMPGGAQSPISSAPAQGGYPPGYGYFPAPPTNPGSPGQTSTPGYPPLGAPGTPGAASYPYPYPPANPQNPNGGYYPAPNQGYGTPTPGFQPPAAPPQPAAGQEGNLEDSNQATPVEQPGQEN